ncbi:MAG: MBL fold metallo-hydrolase [Erysipelotrichaceae bacterium]|nr:MBL fold metallo-hydrolase [Erysipelotrichaceae bacterium]
MEIRTLTLGIYQTNTYLVVNNNEVIVIDPVSKADRIQSLLNVNETIVGICLTHGHFDHIGAVDDLVNIYHCPVYIHEDDLELTQDPEKNYSQTKKIKLKSKLSVYSDRMKIQSIDFEVIHTPGHTKGSVCLMFENNLFTGDTLFKGSIGRTDLYGANPQEMKQSLRTLRSLNENYVIYPGHDGSTTLFDELKRNPYL